MRSHRLLGRLSVPAWPVLLFPWLLLIAACGAASGHTSPPRQIAVTESTGVRQSGQAAMSDQAWAKQALQILDTVDAAVANYHAATEYADYTLTHQQLLQQAYAGFDQALAANDWLWPATQQVKDSSVRDQFVFVMGNIGGFMHPSPDIPGDPAGPTLGDRIARSLQNAVTTSAAVRPKLQRLAGAP